MFVYEIVTKVNFLYFFTLYVQIKKAALVHCTDSCLSVSTLPLLPGTVLHFKRQAVKL